MILMKFKSFLNKLHEKDKLGEDLKEQINNDFSNENSINFKAFKKIKEMDLFDYEFYQKKYNYDL